MWWISYSRLHKRSRPNTVVFLCGCHGQMYKGADKSLVRPGRKQANVSVRMAWISFGTLPCKERGEKTWWQLASWCCWNRARPWHASELVSFLVRLRTYQHPGTDTTNLNEDLELFLTMLMRSPKLLLCFRTVLNTDRDLRWAERLII